MMGDWIIVMMSGLVILASLALIAVCTYANIDMARARRALLDKPPSFTDHDK